jgi:Na+/H+-dicarboxylate symporter
MKHARLLTILILLGLIAGAIVGQFALFGEGIDASHWTKAVGDLILIKPLKLLVIPLVFVSIVAGVTSIGDPSRLGLVGGTTLAYYLSTMAMAVILGAVLVTTLAPGDLPPETQATLVAGAEANYTQTGFDTKIATAQGDGHDSLGGAWFSILNQMVPANIFDEMAKGRTLGVILFSILLGLALALGGATTAPAVRFFNALFAALIRMVLWIIWLAPIGVFFLVAYTVGMIGLGELSGPLGKYMAIVIGGLLIHGLIVLPIVLVIFGRANPYRFMWQMRPALMTAFGTDSSSATLPVTLKTAQTEGGCSKRASNFVLPLGSTINMDGTALYEAVAVIFLFQLYGIELATSDVIIVVITATLAAIGAAGIPSAGLVTMLIVITAVNTSLAGRGIEPLPLSAIGVIIGVDRILDMCRTVVNVWGDSVGAKIITILAPDSPEDDALRDIAMTAAQPPQAY